MNLFREFKTFRSFDAAIVALMKEIPDFATKMAPVFQQNKWEYSRDGATYIPDEKYIRELLGRLLGYLAKQKRNKCAYSSGGRLTLKIFRVGKSYHPVMYCDSFGTT
jgi:hypothetical protein